MKNIFFTIRVFKKNVLYHYEKHNRYVPTLRHDIAYYEH